MNKLSTSIAVLLLPGIIACTNEEKLDAALAIGAQTTSSIFIDECDRRYKKLSTQSYEARDLVLTGLNESKEYFTYIGDEKWISEAVDIGNSSLKNALPTMTEEKCESLIDAIVNDGGILKGKKFVDYYSQK